MCVPPNAHALHRAETLQAGGTGATIKPHLLEPVTVYTGQGPEAQRGRGIGRASG